MSGENKRLRARIWPNPSPAGTAVRTDKTIAAITRPELTSKCQPRSPVICSTKTTKTCVGGGKTGRAMSSASSSQMIRAATTPTAASRHFIGLFSHQRAQFVAAGKEGVLLAVAGTACQWIVHDNRLSVGRQAENQDFLSHEHCLFDVVSHDDGRQ